jgi:hypothetical protein
MPKKMTRYQKQNRYPCASVMYLTATGPVYDPVPRARAKKLNLVPLSCAKNKAVVDIWTKESTGAAPKPVSIFTT